MHVVEAYDRCIEYIRSINITMTTSEITQIVIAVIALFIAVLQLIDPHHYNYYIRQIPFSQKFIAISFVLHLQ